MPEILYEVRGPKSLCEMTFAEVDEALKQTDIIIVPAGCIEQHGAHNPLSTDTINVQEMARCAVRRLEAEGRKVVLGPTIPFGVSPYMLSFAGSISLRTSTFIALLSDVCLSLYGHGFKNICLLLGHGGNLGSMHVVSQELTNQMPDGKVILLNYIHGLLPLFREDPEILNHGGRGETSMVMSFYPNLVQMERARVATNPEAQSHDSEYAMLFGGGVHRPIYDWRKIMETGSLGDPTGANKELGDKMYDTVSSWIADVITKEFVSKA
jgi:creatinine amidohydrolase